MKTLIMILTLIVSASCGQAPLSTSPLKSVPVSCKTHKQIGMWLNEDTGDTLIFNEDCTGSTSLCHQTFSFSAPNGINVNIRMNEEPTDPNQCSPKGITTCALEVFTDDEPPLLAIRCTTSTLVYQKL
jgi:hypothetical protein